jgi:hypothetical protein
MWAGLCEPRASRGVRGFLLPYPLNPVCNFLCNFPLRMAHILGVWDAHHARRSHATRASCAFGPRLMA